MGFAHDAHDAPPCGSGFLVVRPALAGALAFVEAARTGTLDVGSLLHWLDCHVVGPGFMSRPGHVHEPGIGKVPIDVRGNLAWTPGHAARLSRIVATARVRVAVLLGGLLSSPPDDRFLNAAIFAGRVERAAGAHGSVWRPCPTEGDQLSDIVLSLFASDVLSHREEYDRALCVCDMCGRVSLTPDAPSRRRCAQHEG
jgi:hypothetical protein